MYYMREKKSHVFLWAFTAFMCSVAVMFLYTEMRLDAVSKHEETVQAQNSGIVTVQKDDFADIEKYEKAVVKITHEKMQKNGFFVSREGDILSDYLEKGANVTVNNDISGEVIWNDKSLDLCVIKTAKTASDYVSLEGYANAKIADSVAFCTVADEDGYNARITNILSDSKVLDGMLGDMTKTVVYITEKKQTTEGALCVDKNSNPVGIVIGDENEANITILPYRIAGAVAKSVLENNGFGLCDLGITFEQTNDMVKIKVIDDTKLGYTSGLRDGDRVLFINRKEVKSINDCFGELIMTKDKKEFVFGIIRNGQNDEIRIII